MPCDEVLTHCIQVYYPDEVKFWNGIVINDNREGGEDQVQADPYSCGGLWERFTVTWDSTVSIDPYFVPSVPNAVIVVM